MAKRILLVDDESAVLFAYKKVLQREQFKVDAIDSMTGTYELLENNSYDVAILDLRLGGESSQEGFELLGHIKDKHPGTMIIMITAHGNQEIRDKAYQLGADHYFEKPVSTNRIRETLAVSGIMPAVRGVYGKMLNSPGTDLQKE
jgi:DNA-binding NtrC family response regulator